MCTSAPVLFIVFNRPETTAQVFEAIRQARPSRLFIAADGPRPDRPEDIERCADVRRMVSRVDWDCDVQTLFRDTNLGCKYGPSSAIDWFFEQVEEGIILEDDTLPDPTFFRFCTEMLERYRTNEKITMVTGYIGIREYVHPEGYSYSWLTNGSVWGWATWRRAWKLFDLEMTRYPAYKAAQLKRMEESESEREKAGIAFVISRLDEAFSADPIDFWDLQWQFVFGYYHTLCIWPHRNLVRHIGFGDTSTHYQKNQYDITRTAQLNPMDFPLVHPPEVAEHSPLWKAHFEGYARYLHQDLRPGYVKVLNKVFQKFRTLTRRVANG